MLFTFLARQMARHADIAVNRSLFDQVVEALCVVCSSDADCVPGESAVVCGPVAGSLDHEQRQQALLELYAATSSSSTSSVAYFDTARLLQLADGARFYRVVEQVRVRRGEYADVVACYWRDAARRHLTFGYVQSLVAGERPADGGGAARLSDAERERVVGAVMDAVPQLVAIDARRTAKLLTLTLGVPARRVVDRLQRGGGGPGGEACSSDDEALYGFLRGLFDVQLSGGGGGAGVLLPDSEDAAGVAECYVEVMCRRSADVVAFLRAAGAANVRYRLADMTAICRRHGATAALVYLLERAGDVVGAFRLEFDRLTAAVGALCDQQTCGGAGVDASTCVVPGQAGGADVPLRVVPGRSGGAVSPCVVSQRTGGAASPCVVDVGGAGVAVERCVCDVLGLLQRASGQLSAADLQSAWFQLLDFLTQTARLRCDAGVDLAAAAVLKTCTRHVIAAMMSGSGLPLPAPASGPPRSSSSATCASC